MAEASYAILLEGLEVAMGLGIHDVERSAPQRVTLSVRLECVYPAVPSDRIDSVIDYDFLRDGILALAESRHFELQETLCEEIAGLAMRDARIVGVTVRSMKLDIYPDARVGCEIVRRR